ncbi:MAG: tetratricopeptide repeat protein [Pseudomonadales bacterium]|nr:tetratricopeptide repeat protein [Pseudomonadales bacterium]
MDLQKFDAEELIALSQLDLENNNVAGALEKIKAALDYQDCPVVANALAAKIYAQLKLHHKAKPLFATFLEANPNAVTERFQLGMVNLESGEQQTALEIWGNILEVEPTHAPSLYFSAIANLELNNRDDAERHLNVLLQSAPSDNLYFGKGKELLDDLNNSTIPSTNKPQDIYQ